MGSVPGLRRSPRVGNGNPLQYTCRKVPWTEPGALQSTGLQSWTQLSVCTCAHTHTHTHPHTPTPTPTHTHTHTHTHRGNPPQPTFIYLEVTVCDGIGCEFKVVLLGDLGPLTLSTRGDCPLCQTLKADTVSREQIKARRRRGP